MSRLPFCCTLILLSALASTAQQTAPTGTVAGTITFGDTRKPARFAKVILTPVHSDSKKALDGLNEKDVKDNPMAALGAMMSAVTMLSTQTDIQGHYQLAVAPGEYYVMANVSGYVSPSMEDLKSGGDMPGTARIRVEANQTVRGDEALERGATITGTVTFEDGSPVTAAAVTVEPAKKPEKPTRSDDDDDLDIGRGMALAMSGGIKIAVTDDRGQYRVAGLAPGSYHVSVLVAMGNALAMKGGVMNISSMRGATRRTVFAPDTMHEASANAIVARAGQETDGADILVNLSGTHSVSGRVASAVDHHPINSGSIALEDTTDKKVTYTGAVAPDGTFTVLYVPAGTYTLKISEANDTEPAAKKRATGLLNFAQDKVIKSYDDASQPQIVGDSDVVGVQVELKESAKVRQQPDLGSIFGGAAKSQ